MLVPITKGVNYQMNDTMWIEPGKCPTNPENVPVNPENVPIFLNRKTVKQNTKTACAKSEGSRPQMRYGIGMSRPPEGARKAPR